MNEARLRFEEYLQSGASRLGISMDRSVLDKLGVHYAFLRKWSERINLTAVRGEKEAAEKLYLESAFIAPMLESGRPILDAGSGAGFPGLVIKAIRPELTVILVEAREKRAAFLSLVASQMKLGKGLEVKNIRLGQKNFDLLVGEAVSRATFRPQVWCKLASRLVDVGGRIWFFLNGKQDLSSLGMVPPPNFFLDKIMHYKLPFCGKERTLLALRRNE